MQELLPCDQDSSWELLIIFMGENKAQEEGSQQERKHARDMFFCPRSYVGMTLSLFQNTFCDGQNLSLVSLGNVADTSSVCEKL